MPHQNHAFSGLWITADGHIRHELLPNGRYDEARGDRKSAYQGSYVMTGNHIDYRDDTGFTADGDFIDGVLHHAGMILYRQLKASKQRDITVVVDLYSQDAHVY
ncbi:Atu4866 domain-containing protein [Agrobacterium vitis]|uniref:Atu4866 domain-containing protein n=1 Tax=Agrobacterium vitis TaxID=373 RepID=A0AAE2RCI0_AGRVI|nr:Atu4866 domain-containing protein [Agrobacterium vitis]